MSPELFKIVLWWKTGNFLRSVYPLFVVETRALLCVSVRCTFRPYSIMKADSRVVEPENAAFGPLADVRARLAPELVQVTGLTEQQLIKVKGKN